MTTDAVQAAEEPAEGRNRVPEDEDTRERRARFYGDQAAMEWWYRSYRANDEHDDADMGVSTSPAWENAVRTLEDGGA